MTSRGQKAEYVKSEARKGAGGHHCHWPRCETPVAPAMWGCRKHWYLLPQQLRNKIWSTYQPGQEITKRPSARYVEVAREVQDWIAKYHRANGVAL